VNEQLGITESPRIAPRQEAVSDDVAKEQNNRSANDPALHRPNETDKPRQGVVANSLNVFRGGAVGFIVWLDVRWVISRSAYSVSGVFGRSAIFANTRRLEERTVKCPAE
jgi:hypothetical protein